MAATTISDLPQDMLVLIFRAVFASAGLDVHAEECHLSRAPGMHKDLRRVSREWRDAADIAYIAHKENQVILNMNALQDASAARVRFPSMIHGLIIRCPRVPDGCPSHITARALTNLCASFDLRRVLKHVSLRGMMCKNQVAAAVSAIVACPHLTSLELGWMRHEHGDGVQRDVLASLTALTGLKEMGMESVDEWPALPDGPPVTSLTLTGSNSSFAPAGSGASLGRLRRLSFVNDITRAVDAGWASNDPIRLRADMDAGAWRPHLLHHVQTLHVSIICAPQDFDLDVDWLPREYDGATPAAAVWAPLAPTVTKLVLTSMGSVFHDSDLETGMYAGLGALTDVQDLDVASQVELRSPVDFGRVHLPHLTKLSVRDYEGEPIDLARFPRLVHLAIESKQTEPLVLSSVAALRLASLHVSGWPHHERPLCDSPPREPDPKPRLNLAQLFGGGRGLAALTGLSFERVELAWGAAAVAGAPPAAEFGAHARVLLPSLRSAEIKHDVEMEDEVREFVVPAVRALGRG